MFFLILLSIKVIFSQKQIKDSKSHLSIYKKLSRLRQQASFQNGKLEYLIVDEDIFSFLRYKEKNKYFLVILNISDKERRLNLYKTKKIELKANISFYSGNLKKFYSKNKRYKNNIITKDVKVYPRDILVLEWSKK
jgi:hypothetical protein